MKKWNRKLGKSKRELGIKTPKINGGYRLPEKWSHRLWRYKQLVKKLISKNPKWHK